MEVWIFIAALAYLLSAVAFVVDKYLLALPIPKPFTYAFWVAILSTSVLFLIPFFDIEIPNGSFLAVALASGASFFGGLIVLYRTIQKTDVSVASTQVGVLTSIFTYVFSTLILKNILPLNSTAALVLLVLGMFFLGRAGKSITLNAVCAGALIAISFVLLKWTFSTGGFINGLFWTRIGFIGSAFLSLISKRARREVHSTAKNAPTKAKFLFVGNKLLAGGAFLLLYYSILLGNVTIINALLGLQFLFVFLIAIILGKKLPTIAEHTDKKTVAIKSLGILFVLAGFLSILIK